MTLINLIANFEISENLSVGNNNTLKFLNTSSIYIIPKNFTITIGAVGDSYSFNYNFINENYRQFFIIGRFIDINLLTSI